MLINKFKAEAAARPTQDKRDGQRVIAKEKVN